jgi:SnoaL-like domain
MDHIARLIAIEEIKQLKARYFRLMDTRDFAGMAYVFCADAVFDCSEGSRFLPVGGAWKGNVGPIVRGREPIMAWIRASFLNRTSVHHGHCHEVTIDSESEAHGVIAMEDYIRGLDRETKILHAAGHYHERYRFEEDAWRIAETKLTRLFTGP